MQHEEQFTPIIWNLKDPRNLPGFIEALEMATGNDQDLLRGLIEIFSSIGDMRPSESWEYCDQALRSLFIWSTKFNDAEEDFVWLSRQENAAAVASL